MNSTTNLPLDGHFYDTESMNRIAGEAKPVFCLIGLFTVGQIRIGNEIRSLTKSEKKGSDDKETKIRERTFQKQQKSIHTSQSGGICLVSYRMTNRLGKYLKLRANEAKKANELRVK